MEFNGFELDDLIISALHPLVHVHRQVDYYHVHILFRMPAGVYFVSSPEIIKGRDRTVDLEPLLTEEDKKTRLVTIRVGFSDGHYCKDEWYYHKLLIKKSDIEKEKYLHVIINHPNGTHKGDGVIHWPEPGD